MQSNLPITGSRSIPFFQPIFSSFILKIRVKKEKSNKNWEIGFFKRTLLYSKNSNYQKRVKIGGFMQ